MSIVSELAWKMQIKGFPISPPPSVRTAPRALRPGDDGYSIFTVDSSLSRSGRSRKMTSRAVMSQIQKRPSRSKLGQVHVIKDSVEDIDLLCHECDFHEYAFTTTHESNGNLPTDLDDLDKTVSELTDEELSRFQRNLHVSHKPSVG